MEMLPFPFFVTTGAITVSIRSCIIIMLILVMVTHREEMFAPISELMTGKHNQI